MEPTPAWIRILVEAGLLSPEGAQEVLQEADRRGLGPDAILLESGRARADAIEVARELAAWIGSWDPGGDPSRHRRLVEALQLDPASAGTFVRRLLDESVLPAAARPGSSTASPAMPPEQAATAVRAPKTTLPPGSVVDPGFGAPQILADPAATAVPLRPALAGKDAAAGEPPSTTSGSFGRYRILRRLGGGGMGEVFAAYDATLERGIALKVMRPELNADDDGRQRFRREASAMARLRHSNILPVFDSGEERGRLYYTMELVAGETLNGLLRRMRCLTPRAALRIIRDAARGVHYAHVNAIIHRDIKPENLLIAPEPVDAETSAAAHPAERLEFATGSTGHFRVLLMDFGLARELGRSRLTRSGGILGTLLYMSPEQAAGDPCVGVPADVYSLGATLYEALSGVPPFMADREMELLSKIRLEDPVPVRILVPTLHPDVATICQKAMAKEPSRRYRSAHDMAEDMDRHLRGEPIAARPASRMWKVVRLVRRHPVWSSVAATLLATAGVVGGGLYFRTGALTLSVSPPGTRITATSGEWIAQERPLSLDLPAGLYDFRFSCPDHQDEVREVGIERGKAKELAVVLRHDRGVVEATCEPPGSEMLVGERPFGSRIAQQEFDTGTYRLRGWRNGHFEREKEVVVRRGQSLVESLWLEPGLSWSASLEGTSSRTQVVLGPDIDGDGLRDILHQVGNGFVARSIRSGKPLGEWGGGSSLQMHMTAPDLGPPLGPCMVISREEPSGLEVDCVQLRLGLPRAWGWTSPVKQAWKHPFRARNLALADLDGDGVREIAVGGRDHALWILGGATGLLMRRIPTPVHPLYYCPPDSSPARLVLVGSQTRPDMPVDESFDASPATAACVRLADGAVEWVRTEVGRLVGILDLDGDGTRAIYALSGRLLCAIDAASGSTIWSATLAAEPGRSSSVLVADVDDNGPCDLVIPYPDAGLLEAISGKDGHSLWCARLRVPFGPSKSLSFLAPHLLLVAGEESYAALDGRDGSMVWSQPGQVSAWLVDTRLAKWEREVGAVAFIQGQGLVFLDHGERKAWTLHLEHNMTPVACTDDLDGDGRHEFLLMAEDSSIAVAHWPTLLWERPSETSLLATPILADVDRDGRVEVVQLGPWRNNHGMVCLDGATGRLRWGRTELMAPNRGPGLGDVDGDGAPEFLVVGQKPGRTGYCLWAFRGRDGEPIREWPLDSGRVYCVPGAADVNGDGAIDPVLLRWDGQDIVAVDGRSDGLLWRYPTGAFAMGAPTIADLDGDGRPDVVAPTMDGFLHAVRGSDGAALWKAALGPGGSRAPAAVADVNGDGAAEVAIVSRGGALHVFEAATGKPMVVFQGGTEGFGRPVVIRLPEDGRTLLLAPLGAAGVIAVDVEAQKVLWQGPAGREVWASPVVADLNGDGSPEAVVGTCDGVVAVLDPRTGKILWQLAARLAAIEGDPVVGDLDGDSRLDILTAHHGGVLRAIDGRAIHLRIRE